MSKSVQAPHRPWSTAEITRLRDVYEFRAEPFTTSAQLAGELGRSKCNVSRKARELGLTDPTRRRVAERKVQQRKFATEEERRAHISALTKARIATRGHPRGMLGKKQSPENIARMSALHRHLWADPASAHNSESRAQASSDANVAWLKKNGSRQGYSRGAGGRRADLGGRYFRSAWEANYARYLNLLVAQKQIASWGFEEKTFWFEAIKRGTRSYTPDFRVTKLDGASEWHEVKGWLDPKSKTRLDRMARYFPSEKIVLIDAAWFRSANKSGLAAVIPAWEKSTGGSNFVARHP